jgi:hypothetical protein
MLIFRRFVRWLARKEIAQAQNEAIALVAQVGKPLDQLSITVSQVPLTLISAQAFAEGQIAGREEMWDRLNAIVGERMGGAQDVVTSEDLARARKGLLH